MDLERSQPETGAVRVAVAAEDPIVAAAIARLLEEAGAVIEEEIDAAEVVLWDAGADVADLPERLAEIDRLRAPCVVMLADGGDAATAVAAGAAGAVARDAGGDLLAAGMSNKRIGRALGISEHTAKFHVNSILAKLGADTRTEAVVTAARRGLIIL